MKTNGMKKRKGTKPEGREEEKEEGLGQGPAPGNAKKRGTSLFQWRLAWTMQSYSPFSTFSPSNF